jgi:ABC-type nickel/cobalt efflux system permease component RcnA
MIIALGLLVGIIITVLVVACYVLAIAFTVWMIIDAGKQDRFWWLVLVIGVPIIGPSVYYFTEKKHEYTKVPVHHVHDSLTERQHESAPKKKSPHIHHDTVLTEEKELHQNQEEVVVIPKENKEEGV